MSTLGVSYNISKELNNENAVLFAQWIGSSNVARNCKIRETNLAKDATQSYSHIRKQFDFMSHIPVQIIRNSISELKSSYVAAVKGIRKDPKIKPKHRKRSAIITSELFTKTPVTADTTLITIYNHAKQNKEPVFCKIVEFAVDKIGNQLRISRQGKMFSLSFSFDDGVKRKSNDQLLEELAHLSLEELKEMTIGLDRNVALAGHASDNTTYHYSVEEQNKLKEINAKKQRYQRILAKVKTKHTKNVERQKNKARAKKEKTKNLSLEANFEGKRQAKLQEKITKMNKKISDIRLNACHHWSKDLAQNAPALVIFEALKIKNMTKKAKPKLDENGRGYARNNKAAKSGLNRAILNASLGRFGDLSKYKLNLLGKAWLDVPPHNTSVIHNTCGGKNTERPIQSVLICHDCNEEVHADYNASLNIEDRGIQHLKDGTFFKKKKASKKTAIRKNKTVEVEST